MSSLRRRREAAGLTQADLAAAAGLSRQLVTAVEAGRNTPGVAAALALAGVLETSVEALFGDATPRRWTPLGGDVGPEGAQVVAGHVGEEWVYCPVATLDAAGFAWPRSDGRIVNGDVELWPGVSAEGFVVAGCDPALGLAAGMLPEHGPRRLAFAPTTSAGAVRAVTAGLVHAAVVHGPLNRLAHETPGTIAIPLVRWQVGLGSTGEIHPDLERVASGELSVARRPPGAEAQRALERALETYGGTGKLRGPVASSHIQSASLAANKFVDLSTTMEPAALAAGLDFEPLEEHTVEIRVRQGFEEHPGLQALLDTFGSRGFGARLRSLGGYEVLV